MATTSEGNRAVTKGEFAYREIRDLIVNGTLEPGERLRLRPLAARLGVSVMPVRDALRTLELEGLVSGSDHQSTYVASVTGGEILTHVGLRMWIEVNATVQAAEAQDVRSIERARQALEAGEKAASSGRGTKFTEVNRRFHHWVEMPADSLVKIMIEDLWSRLWQVRGRGSLFVLRPDRMAEAQAEHAAILSAVEARDPVAAAAASQQHRLCTLAAWRDVLAESE